MTLLLRHYAGFVYIVKKKCKTKLDQSIKAACLLFNVA